MKPGTYVNPPQWTYSADFGDFQFLCKYIYEVDIYDFVFYWIDCLESQSRYLVLP